MLISLFLEVGHSIFLELHMQMHDLLGLFLFYGMGFAITACLGSYGGCGSAYEISALEAQWYTWGLDHLVLYKRLKGFWMKFFGLLVASAELWEGEWYVKICNYHRIRRWRHELTHWPVRQQNRVSRKTRLKFYKFWNHHFEVFSVIKNNNLYLERKRRS